FGDHRAERLHSAEDPHLAVDHGSVTDSPLLHFERTKWRTRQDLPVAVAVVGDNGVSRIGRGADDLVGTDRAVHRYSDCVAWHPIAAVTQAGRARRGTVLGRHSIV